MTTEALKPCPFCGAEAEIERYGAPRQSTIYACTECGCRLETGEEWNYGARWNTRPTPLAPWTREELEARKRLERIADDFASNWNDAIDVEEAPPEEIEIDTADVEAIRLILSCPDGWRPIETAPKNATDVLVIWPSEKGWPTQRAMVAHWAQGGGEDQPAFGPAWFFWNGYGNCELKPAPTHWMPAPLPPLQKAEGEGT